MYTWVSADEARNFCDDTSYSGYPAFGARVSLAFECLDFHVCVFPVFQLQHEKAELEQHLEQEQEFQVNKLMKKIKKLENDTISKQLTLEQVRIYSSLRILSSPYQRVLSGLQIP